ncbi:hypothetical protein BGZ46_009199 [Entomortierella lignicola]|nr:hypothetical protein BGZ46_009199 [Entomortierella lignicola]
MAKLRSTSGSSSTIASTRMTLRRPSSKGKTVVNYQYNTSSFSSQRNVSQKLIPLPEMKNDSIQEIIELEDEDEGEEEENGDGEDDEVEYRGEEYPSYNESSPSPISTSTKVDKRLQFTTKSKHSVSLLNAILQGSLFGKIKYRNARGRWQRVVDVLILQGQQQVDNTNIDASENDELQAELDSSPAPPSQRPKRELDESSASAIQEIQHQFSEFVQYAKEILGEFSRQQQYRDKLLDALTNTQHQLFKTVDNIIVKQEVATERQASAIEALASAITRKWLYDN